jgi:UDP-glucuronate 4-epimerase
MRALVTGAAGFIGSHLSERLCSDGWSVVGVDSLTDYYSTRLKEANLETLVGLPNFEYARLDLWSDPLEGVLDGVDVVFHQAGQPGVRSSWASFDRYLRDNTEATQRLLQAATDHPDVEKFIFASSSSVYGAATDYPTSEEALPNPQSPYGVSKLAAEHLCGVYARNFGLATVALRYFTVFGPRQRPDMAMNRLIGSVIHGRPFPLFGDGNQIRDFTYVSDVVEANVLAATADLAPGFVANVAGGTPATMRDVIDSVTDLSGSAPIIEQFGSQAGDVRRTGGAVEKIGAELSWKPKVGLEEGLRRQIEWQIQSHRALTTAR